MNLAHAWFQKCNTLHKTCNVNSISGLQLPTRLIDTGPPGARPRLRLCTSTFPHDTCYTTLSHCWGTIDIPKLTRDTKDLFQRSIPIDGLPQTFQDAVYITREFGFRYLWIDSLCIIQDDEHDWRQESARMASVYGGSSLNIAASGASDGTEGCFFPRDVNLIRRCLVSAAPDPDKEVQGLYYCTDSNLHDRCFYLSPLSQRAWAFQERFLSPRTLHFGESQLFWECGEDMSCETFPDGLPKEFPVSGLCLFEEKNSRLNRLWASVVGTYTRGELTNETDKLVAISGVARYLAEKLGAQYLAGIWKEHLPGALLWYVLGGPSVRLQIPRAPTWSWASVDGPIWALWAGGSKRVRIVDVHLTIVGDPFGQVEGGLLRVDCGRMVKAKICPATGRTGYDLLIGSPQIRQRSTINVLLDEKSPDLAREVFLLEILKNEHRRSIGLMLLEARNGEKGQYRRIGRYEAHEDFVGWFDEAQKEHLDESEEAKYETILGINEDGQYRYIIGLV